MDRSTNTSNTGSTHICLWMQNERISVLIIVVLEVPSLIPEILIYQCSIHWGSLLPMEYFPLIQVQAESTHGIMKILSTHIPRNFGGFTLCPVIVVVDILLHNAGRTVDSSSKLLTVDDLDGNVRRTISMLEASNKYYRQALDDMTASTC